MRYTERSPHSPTFSNRRVLFLLLPLKIVHSTFSSLPLCHSICLPGTDSRPGGSSHKYPFPFSFPILSLPTLIAYREPSRRRTEETEARSSPEEHPVASCTLSQRVSCQFHSAQTPPRAHRSPPKPDRTPLAQRTEDGIHCGRGDTLRRRGDTLRKRGYVAEEGIRC